jgi:peptidoglycan hydrolase CwlO-like protein
MLRRIDETIEGISAAIEKGMTQRTKSEQNVRESKNELAETARKLNEIKEKLMRVRMAADGG